MRLAFYGRFSSDNQRETSIADQLRIVQRWAHQHGHKVISEFSDEATSGASLKLLLGSKGRLTRQLLSRDRLTPSSLINSQGSRATLAIQIRSSSACASSLSASLQSPITSTQRTIQPRSALP